jgi:hypothetical protein
VTGNVAVDTDTLFVDSVNDRVGIGTTNPLTIFDTHGTSRISAAYPRFDFYTTTSRSTDAWGNSTGAAGDYRIYANGDASDGTKRSLNFDYGQNSVHTSRMVINAAGNVGIGTTDPGAPLHVNGDIAVGASGALRRTADNDLINIYAGSDNTSPYMFMTGKSRSSSPNKIGFRIESVAKLEMYTDKIYIADKLGIGYTAPESKLDLRNTVIYNGETGASFNPGTMGLLEFRAANTDATRWNMTVHENNDLYFLCRTSGSALWHKTGYLMDNTDVSNITFTGQHRSFIDGMSYTEYDNLEGLIVSANKNKYYDVDENITTGANAIQISQSLPLVSVSSKEKDKACFGVISGSEDPESREYVQGSYVSVIRKQKGDTRAFINSVGEGAIWVTNINGPLESGDYITTSNVAGYGMKQESDSLKNYTVAKITMDCDFSPVTQPIQNIKKDETGENTLDEHGQIQWEDHAIETEKAYKIRYLDANGVITDEANVVHTAAFVGCTYHCG